jgi:hypothetical protein
MNNDAANGKEEEKRPTLTKVKAIGHAEQSAGAIARDVENDRRPHHLVSLPGYFCPPHTLDPFGSL